MQEIDIVERTDFESLEDRINSLEDEVNRLRETITMALASLPEPPF